MHQDSNLGGTLSPYGLEPYAVDRLATHALRYELEPVYPVSISGMLPLHHHIVFCWALPGIEPDSLRPKRSIIPLDHSTTLILATGGTRTHNLRLKRPSRYTIAPQWLLYTHMDPEGFDPSASCLQSRHSTD